MYNTKSSFVVHGQTRNPFTKSKLQDLRPGLTFTILHKMLRGMLDGNERDLKGETQEKKNLTLIPTLSIV